MRDVLEQRWESYRNRWLAVAIVALVAPFGVFCTAQGVAWLGQPFPGFFVAENLTIPSVGRYTWSGIRAGVPFHSRVVAVEGVAVREAEDVYRAASTSAIGAPIRYTFVKDGARFERTVPTMRFARLDYLMTIGLFTANGWLPLAAGALIFFLQPASRAARVFFLMGVTYAIFPFTGMLLYRPPGAWVAPVHLTAQALLPATFLHLAWTFPVERQPAARRRWVLGVPYLVSAALALWSVLRFRAVPPDLTPLYAVWLLAACAIVAMWATAGYAYLRGGVATVRHQARIVVIGFLTGTSAAFVVFLDNAQGGGHIPMNFLAVTPILFFAAVGYAIVRHDLFAVDRLVRQGVEYGILSLLITLIYATTLVIAERLVGPDLRAAPAFMVLFIIAVAFAVDPLRRQVQRVVDRTFYRSRPDYRGTLREVSIALATMLDLREVATRVGETLVDAIASERVIIDLWPEGGETMEYSTDEGEGQRSALRAWITRDPRPINRPALDGATLPDVVALRDDLDRIGAVLVMPLVLSGRALGCLALGRKRSGRPYDREDRDLLTTLANQTAIAVQNASSYRQLQTVNRRLEDKVAERTSELQQSHDELALAYQRLQATQGQLIQAEKMASLGQLVAGVAHELNNPLTFIVGNIVPIREQLEALRAIAGRGGDGETLALCDDMAQILSVIGSGAERTASIVKDLRAFSHREEGSWSLADLRAGVDVTLNLLRPRWKERIVIHRMLDDLPMIECDPGQINQVFMNIVSNACDAIPDSGNIWIRSRAEPGSVVIAIRDDGVGISSEHLARLFDPFFTTKEVGQGTGLGLSIAHGIVERHRGRIDVWSEVGRGTEFTVVLPLRAERLSVA